jgi:hypothetical protein
MSRVCKLNDVDEVVKVLLFACGLPQSECMCGASNHAPPEITHVELPLSHDRHRAESLSLSSSSVGSERMEQLEPQLPNVPPYWSKNPPQRNESQV